MTTVNNDQPDQDSLLRRIELIEFILQQQGQSLEKWQELKDQIEKSEGIPF